MKIQININAKSLKHNKKALNRGLKNTSFPECYIELIFIICDSNSSGSNAFNLVLERYAYMVDFE